MGFDTIPAIPEDYPLYDWADWQSSRDALVQGGPTKYFVKEAWNAIVDELSDAVTAAGQTWDSTYTTAAGAKITISDPKLYARKFNSVRLNIDRQMHLEWPWAVNESFRGYVGREDFQGRQDAGKACDLVYPEYIIELVRKLNLLLEIMRGTGPICDVDVPRPSSTQRQAEVRSGVGARVDCRHNASIAASSEVWPAKSAHVASTALVASKQSVTALSRIAEPVYHKSISKSTISAGGQSKPGICAEPTQQIIDSAVSAEVISVMRQRICQLSAEQISSSVYCVGANSQKEILAAPSGVISLSSIAASAQTGLPRHVVATRISNSSMKVGGIAQPARRIKPNTILSHSRVSAETKAGVSSALAVSKRSVSVAMADIVSGKTVLTDAEAISQTIAVAELNNGVPIPVSLSEMPLSIAKADIDMGLSLPMSPNGVIVSTSMQSDLTLADPVRAASTVNATAIASAECQCGISGQIGRAYVSGAIISCDVGNGWLAPVWVSGGLWIRQVHDEPVQRDNGDLEVS